jgi:mono/diheme cytochrome c family protein
VSGLRGREQDFLVRLARERASAERPETKALLSLLAATIVHFGDRARIEQVVALASDKSAAPAWVRTAMVQGVSAVAQPAFRRTMAPGRMLKAETLAPLQASATPEIKSAADKLAARLARYEEEARERARSVRPLSGPERQLVKAGAATYQICSGCHQPNGEGLPNVAPSLVESPWVAGNPEMLVRIVLNGKEGTPGFPGAMPPIASAFTDEQIAGVLSYVRNSWGLHFGAVSVDTVAKVRQQIGPRVNAWTNAELALLERELAKAAR